MVRASAILLGAFLVVVGCGSEDDAPVRAAAPVDECRQIREFAALISGDDPGAGNYKASVSPATMAARVDAVFSGHLTGEFASRSAKPDEPIMSWVSFEVSVDHASHGAVGVGDEVFVAVPVDPTTKDPSVYEESIVPGAQVVVFGHEMADPPAEFLAPQEGLAVGCDSEPPIGRIGKSPQWNEARSLADLVVLAEQTTEVAEVTLSHCGINTVRYEGREWEVPDAERPFDQTSAPMTFAGVGRLERVGADELIYTDESGVTLRFVPDDGTEPPCA